MCKRKIANSVHIFKHPHQWSLWSSQISLISYGHCSSHTQNRKVIAKTSSLYFKPVIVIANEWLRATNHFLILQAYTHPSQTPSSLCTQNHIPNDNSSPNQRRNWCCTEWINQSINHKLQPFPFPVRYQYQYPYQPSLEECTASTTTFLYNPSSLPVRAPREMFHLIVSRSRTVWQWEWSWKRAQGRGTESKMEFATCAASVGL